MLLQIVKMPARVPTVTGALVRLFGTFDLCFVAEGSGKAPDGRENQRRGRIKQCYTPPVAKPIVLGGENHGFL